MLKFNRTNGAIETTPQDVARRLDQNDRLLVLDVRQPNEYAEAHVAGSTLIPLDQLSFRLGELPKDQDIAVICRSGNRSGVATGVLRRAGFNAVNVKGGILAWQHHRLPVEHGR
jgi:rhodanese-related sulfurtransferase